MSDSPPLPAPVTSSPVAADNAVPSMNLDSNECMTGLSFYYIYIYIYVCVSILQSISMLLSLPSILTFQIQEFHCHK